MPIRERMMIMTDLEKVLKNNLHNYKKVKETNRLFCCNTIILIAETYEKISDGKEIYKHGGHGINFCNKIYKVEVIIDGETVFERYGKDANEMNKNYLLALDMCQG